MSDDRRRLLNDSSDLSSFSTPTLVGGVSPEQPQSSSARHRPGYTRIASTSGPDEQVRGAAAREEEGADTADTFNSPASSSHGLGITGVRKVSIQEIPRVPVSHGGKSPPTPNTPAGIDKSLGTPGSGRHGSSPGLGTMFEEESTEYLGGGGARGHFTKPSVSSLGSEYQQTYDYPDDARLRSKRSVATSIRSAYENPFHPEEACPTQGSFHRGRTNWLAIVILILSVYSTVFSGLYVGIAFKGPKYPFIRTTGSISPSSASLITAIVAKTIELSFASVFVAFLGQVLSRRAVSKRSKGITLAEMSMRNWIMQPGTMLTHWETVRYAAFSFLGLVSLLAALMAMLYTSASDALVSPQLKFGNWENQVMQGRVHTQFSNPIYMAEQCATPIRNDKEVSGTTCLQIEHAAQGYHNYQRYINFWSDIRRWGNGTNDLKHRPQGFGLLHENTSITAEWINIVDMDEAYNNSGKRIINNVSLAMPHAGIFQAAREPRNGILQPEDLNGLGVYSIKASVPSPVLHVLCANVNDADLEPIIWEKWPEAKKPVDIAQWPRQVNFSNLDNYGVKTNVDKIFGWGESVKQAPPLFPKLPKEYNTILNQSFFKYGRDSIYLLGKGGPNEGGAYVLCSLKVSLTPNCSTEYTVASKGGSLRANCEDPANNTMAYIRSIRNASLEDGVKKPNADWPNIASEWGNSLSLNAGVNDANASNSRLLTQLILQEPKLNPALPSVAEALAVMGGCTLLMATDGAPFVGFWNYTEHALDEPQYQYFNASIRRQQFASGGVFPYQRGFYVVLFFVFVTNALVLVYFLFNEGLVTDFSEPQNLFSLAVNSPPSHLLAGSCGGGPQGDQYRVNWFVSQEKQHLFMESEEPPGFRGGAHGKGRPEGIELGESPVSRMYSKLSKRRSRL